MRIWLSRFFFEPANNSIMVSSILKEMAAIIIIRIRLFMLEPWLTPKERAVFCKFRIFWNYPVFPIIMIFVQFQDCSQSWALSSTSCGQPYFHLQTVYCSSYWERCCHQTRWQRHTRRLLNTSAYPHNVHVITFLLFVLWETTKFAIKKLRIILFL